MSIYSYFTDEIIHTVFPDIRRIRSKKGKAIMFYSDQFKQIIYLRVSDNREKLRKRDMLKYQARANRDMLRQMKHLYGRKQGLERFRWADKLDVIIINDVCSSIYRYLSALNHLRTPDNVYNGKTYHCIFNASKKPYNEIAGTIYGILYSRINKQLVATESSFKKKNTGKDKEIKPFGEIKEFIDAMRYTCNKLQSKHYEFMGTRKISPEVKAEFTAFVNDLRQAKMLKPEMNLNAKIKFEKEPYKADIEIT